MAVIAEEHVAHQICGLSMTGITALVVVFEAAMRNGQRAAQTFASTAVDYRPRRRQPRLTNVVRTVSPAENARIASRPAAWHQPGRDEGVKRSSAVKVF